MHIVCVRAWPSQVVYPFLLDIGDMLMSVLEPSDSERRKSCLKVAIRALRDMVVKLPMVSCPLRGKMVR